MYEDRKFQDFGIWLIVEDNTGTISTIRQQETI